MIHSLRARLALAALVLVSAAGPLAAQSPTPEGTPITNTATATWSDANGNAYDAVTASVTVTVGFLAGIDVQSPGTAAPASPSSGNELVFTIHNVGNGVDTFTVATSAEAGVTISGYKVGVNVYATLAELNTALDATEVPAGGTVAVTVVYTVAPGMGGQPIALGLTATSQRSGATSDSSSTSVTPAVNAAVNVTPDGATVSRLPSNGTQYTATFTVQNTGNADETYALAAAVGASGVLSIVSVNGTAGTSGSIAVSAGASQSIDVVYTVAASATTGATETITLTATSGVAGSVSDTGTLAVTVVRAALAMSKEAYEDDRSTLLTASDRVLPGDYIQYKITVTNGGVADATTVKVTDALSPMVAYDSAEGDAAGWTISESGGTVTADLSDTVANGASRYFWIRVQVR